MTLEKYDVEGKKKIVILGRPGCGKTSLIRVFFEGADPVPLLIQPITPTMGVNSSHHRWLNLEIGLFDTSGQEFKELIFNVQEKEMVLSNASIIIYAFDYSGWHYSRDIIIEEIQELKKAIGSTRYEHSLVVIMNKIDIIPSGLLSRKLASLEEEIENTTGLPVHFTSIFPHLLHYLHMAFCNLLSTFSENSLIFKRVLDKYILNAPMSLAMVTGSTSAVIAYSMNENFAIEQLPWFYSILSHLERDDIEYLSLVAGNGMKLHVTKSKAKTSSVNHILICSGYLELSTLKEMTRRVLGDLVEL